MADTTYEKVNENTIAVTKLVSKEKLLRRKTNITARIVEETARLAEVDKQLAKLE